MSPSIMPPAAFLQEQSEWCWAAVAEIVLRCMGISDTERNPDCFRNQCVMARKMFDSIATNRVNPPQTGCCPVLNSNLPCPYNSGVSIEEIKELYRQFGLSCTFKDDGPLKLAEIEKEIDLKRPVQVIFRYRNSSGGHVAVIYGYEKPDENQDSYLIVNDPLQGWDMGYVDYDYLVSFYDLSSGDWAATLYEFGYI